MPGDKEFTTPTNSYWIDSVSIPSFPQLEEDITVDVAIVGGGITGITSAYLLTQRGLKVAIAEAGKVLHGTTGHTTAKVTSQHSLIYARLIKEMGSELARQYAEANETAIKMIHKTIEEQGIDCDFSWLPAYVYTQSEQYIKDIQDETRAAKELGIDAAYQEKIPLPFKIWAAVRFDRQAQFHPLKYLKVLAEYVTDHGGYIFEDTVTVNLEDKPVTVITKNGPRIKADKIIVASHYPFFDGGGFFITRIYADKSYALAIKAQEKFPEGTFITAETPTRSLRAQKDGGDELIIVGGEHHKTGDETDTNVHYRNLIEYARNSFTVTDIPYRWSTQDCMTIDGVPYVGHLTPRSPDIYVATGFNKWGMTNSMASSMILADLITKGDSPWAPVYNPSRFNLASVKTFLVQNADVAKELVSGKMARLPEDVDVKPGEAQVLAVEGQKMGVYRDDEGELHWVDTTCTHLGCELKWNEAERTWDCPCHGSRFGYNGDVVEGPAFYQLQCDHTERNQVEARIFS
ncbi:MAG: FAD-dependent oxidoreductase [Deltaproteobacteria bacterium]